jgi:putative polyhydroxyalkanoate system protein
MYDIHIHRDHALGLQRARQITRDWVAQAENIYGVRCTGTTGEAEDCIQLARAGVTGTLTVSATRFDLALRLGFLLGSFKDRIAGEIARNLDAMLADAQANETNAANPQKG